MEVNVERISDNVEKKLSELGVFTFFIYKGRLYIKLDDEFNCFCLDTLSLEVIGRTTWVSVPDKVDIKYS